MSLLKVSGNASGTGTLTIAAPNTNSDYTLTLPQATTTFVGTDATQTLTNKTLSTGLVMGVSAITSGTAVASTSGTSIDFTSIPSWVKRITVMFSGVSTSGTSNPMVQIGTSGGIQNTGYLSTATYGKTSTLVSVNGTTGFPLTAGTTATDVRHGSYILTLLDSATGTWSFFGVSGTSNDTQTGWGGGSKVLSGTLDRVRITTVNGTDTFDAGSINILYE